MKKNEIIDKIEEKSYNYKNIAKDYLKHFKNLNNFEISILSEVICGIIENHYSIEQSFSEISKQYSVNCKKIVFWAIMPSVNLPTIRAKILFVIHINEIICNCVNVMKNDIVQIAFKGA